MADSTSPARRRRVWIVDDSALDAERARRALTSHFATEVFDDGASALEALTAPRRQLPDVLVLDWLMPGVSGLDVCRYLRAGTQDEALRRIGVLMLTVHQRTEQVVEGLEAGANDFLSKPYAEAELRARVGVLVRNRELLERAEHAEAALSHLLANSPDPLLGLDDLGRVAYASPEARHLLGRIHGELFGRPIELLLPGLRNWATDDDVSPGRAPSRPDLEIGDQIYAPVVRLASTGENVTRVVSLRNVTLQRQSERRRLDFYSVVAHDLRSPLSATLLRLEVLLRGGSGQLAPAVHSSLLKMQRNMRDLIAMVNDFLDLARYESGIQMVGSAEVDMATLVEETVEDSRPLIDASQLELRVELVPRPLVVRGDRHRLKQVIGNLLANAIKFTPPGGTVTVRGTCVEREVVVEVQDTGRGIDPERLPTIFERYSRALDDEHEVVGSGLGLMIVREIVRAHDGSVEVESARAEGSTFRLRLPGTAPAHAAE